MKNNIAIQTYMERFNKLLRERLSFDLDSKLDMHDSYSVTKEEAEEVEEVTRQITEELENNE